MDTKKYVTQFRLSGWSEAVKERMTSGQIVNAFCAEKGISKTTYYYRERRVREAVCTELARALHREAGIVPSGRVQLADSEPATIRNFFRCQTFYGEPVHSSVFRLPYPRQCGKIRRSKYY